MKKLLIAICVFALSQPAIAQNFQAGKPLDNEDRSMVESITWEHGQIHRGEMFYVIVDSALGNGDSLNVMFVTPDSRNNVHFFMAVSVTEDITLYIFEADTLAEGGDTLAVFNHNRNSTNTTDVIVAKQATIQTASSFRIWKEPISSTKKGFTEHRDHGEIPLRRNTTYTILAISGAINNTVFIYMNWYEKD